MPPASSNDPRLDSSRGKIVRMLRRARQSVNELAAALGLTDNAVRANLVRLERDGLVVQTGVRPSFRKPEGVYDITPEAERLFARAYAPVLATLLSVLESKLTDQELEAYLRDVGHRLAAPYLSEMSGLSLEQRAEKTLQILEGLGGQAELENRQGECYVRGSGCPFSQVVPEHPRICQVAEAMVSDLLGREVEEHCDRSGPRSRCCFAMK